MPRKLRFYNVKNRERKKRMKHCKTEENVEDSEHLALQNSEQSVTEDSEQLVIEESEQPVAEDSEQSVNEDSEQSFAEDYEQSVTEDSEQSTVKESEQSIAEDSEQSVIEESEQSVTEDSEKSVTADPEQVPLKASEQNSGPLYAGIHSRLLELQSQISLPSNWSSQISKDKNRLLFCRTSQQAGPAQHHSR